MNALRLFGASIWSHKRINAIALSIFQENAKEQGYYIQPEAKYYSEDCVRRQKFNRIFFGIQYLGFGYHRFPDRSILVTADQDYNFLLSLAMTDELGDYMEIRYGNLLIILNTEDSSYTVYLK